MSSNRTGDWLDALRAHEAGASHLPDDPFTPTTGSNYGLDGYNFDTPYNEGVTDSARLPESRGIAGLPDGIVTDPKAAMLTDEDGFSSIENECLDLTSMMEEGSPDAGMEKFGTALSGLEWLDPTQEQDPSRLPEGVNPIDTKFIDEQTFFSGEGTTIPELEEAWGVDRRTDGLRLIPNKDKDILDYEKSIKEDQKAGLPGGNDKADQTKQAILRAMRRSAYGDTLVEIARGLQADLGGDPVMTKKAMRIIAAEHGLAGNVFIRASAFPGIRMGKWTKFLKKVARSARYVVDANCDPHLATMLGMEAVAEVPWKAAHKHYAMLLAPLGYKFASSDDPKEALRRAFLVGPPVKKAAETTFPVDQRPADRISKEAAFEQFAATPIPGQGRIDLTYRALTAARAKAARQISQWREAGLLHPADAHRLLASGADPRAILKTGADLIAQTGKTANYEGQGTSYQITAAPATREQVWAVFEGVERESVARQAAFDTAQRQKVVAYLRSAMVAGLLSPEDAKKVAAQKTTADVMKMATALIGASWSRKHALPVGQKAADYTGPSFEVAQTAVPAQRSLSAHEKRIFEAAAKSGHQVNELKRLLKWAQVKMSEGLAGSELNALMRARFTGSLITAGGDLLRELRAQHEGLAGRLYVDAAAYASVSGSDGCERGALAHRANNLKYVLSMDRCASCTHARDGVCEKYGKMLASTAPVADAKAYQKEALRMTDASDAEVTASYFAPVHNPGEFDLTDPMTNFDLGEAPDNTSLGDILFDGGMEL